MSHTGTQQNPLEALVRGLLAGVAGTAAMDLLLFYRFKRGGGHGGFLDWEFSAGLDDWSKASAPAQVGKRLFEGFFQIELSPHWAALTNNVMHWAYGLTWGAMYGLIAGSVYLPRIRSGLLFGAAVWAADYIILPLAKLYKPIWEYDLPTLAKDFSAHVVYGVAASVAFKPDRTRLVARNDTLGEEMLPATFAAVEAKVQPRHERWLTFAGVAPGADGTL